MLSSSPSLVSHTNPCLSTSSVCLCAHSRLLLGQNHLFILDPKGLKETHGIVTAALNG